MSYTEKSKEKPKKETSSSDISTSPSGSPCICKDKRDIMCQIHGG